MSQRGDRAKELFAEGYNCGQAVFLACEDVTGMERPDAARLTNCLGGGLSQTGGVCGAVSAACLALSAKYGRDNASREGEHARRQENTYKLAQELHRQFEETYGSTLCPALLERGLADSGEAQNNKFNCSAYVEMAADFVHDAVKGE